MSLRAAAPFKPPQRAARHAGEERTMIICATCIKVHGRDTNTPIQCPVCKQIVGCFWHARAGLHIRRCERAARGLPPLEPLFEEDERA